MVSEEKDSLPSAEPSLLCPGVHPKIKHQSGCKQHIAKEISAKKDQPAINSKPNHALF
jgi:hypothetical protein